jgi:hypothetical protein
MKIVSAECRLEARLLELPDRARQIALHVSVKTDGGWETLTATPSRDQVRQLRRELGDVLNAGPTVKATSA